MTTYLNTEDAAAYLGIKERKLYELVANGAVPCSKVTGKWLFPRDALDRWVEAGLAHPEGFIALAPPPIIGGSQDPLLEWAVRRSGSGLALLSEGSKAGLDRLARNEVAMAAIHLHGPDPDDSANIATVAAQSVLHDAVIIAFARREQGLLTAPGNPKRLTNLVDVAGTAARFGRRQGGAGADLLFLKLAADAGLEPTAFNTVTGAFNTGNDLAFAIRAGEIDCGIASRAIAASHGCDFQPLTWERFDLAMRRRTYFEPGPQKLFNLMRTADFSRHAEQLTGYNLSEAGCVRLNR
jgi:excisionase family DNA binding protein